MASLRSRGRRRRVSTRLSASRRWAKITASARWLRRARWAGRGRCGSGGRLCPRRNPWVDGSDVPRPSGPDSAGADPPASRPREPARCGPTRFRCRRFRPPSPSSYAVPGVGRRRHIRRQGLRARQPRPGLGPQRREEPLLRRAVRVGVRPGGAGEPPGSAQTLPARRPVPGARNAFRSTERLGPEPPMAVRRPPVVGEPPGPPRREEGAGFGNPPGAESTGKRVGFASHSRRSRGRADRTERRRSAPPPSPVPRKVAIERRPRPARRRQPR